LALDGAGEFRQRPGAFLDNAPAAIRDQLRADVQSRVAASMRSMGVSRHAHDEIVELGVRSLAALSLKLADRPYIMGRTPCGSMPPPSPCSPRPSRRSSIAAAAAG